MFFHNFLHIQNNFGAYTSSIQYHLWQTALSISVCQLVSGILLDSGVWSSRDSSTGWCWGFCRCLGYEFRARQAFAENVETNNCFNWKKACKMRQMLFTLGLGASPGPSTAGMPSSSTTDSAFPTIIALLPVRVQVFSFIHVSVYFRKAWSLWQANAGCLGGQTECVSDKSGVSHLK